MQHGQLPPATGDTMIDDTMAADLLSEHAWADPSTGARSCCGTLTPTTPNNLPEHPQETSKNSPQRLAQSIQQ